MLMPVRQEVRDHRLGELRPRAKGPTNGIPNLTRLDRSLQVQVCLLGVIMAFGIPAIAW